MRAILILVLVASSAFALTPKERKIVLHARDELLAAKKALVSAQSDAGLAWDSADQADSRAATAQHQAEVSQKAAITNKQILDKWQPQIDQDKRWFGLGRIVFGFADLAKHLLILGAVLGGLSLAIWILSMIPIFGWLKPVLAILLFLPRKAIAAITKPKT
jgi:hypothetical protein